MKDLDFSIIKEFLFGEARRGLTPDTVRSQLSSIKHLLYPFRHLFKFLYDGNIELKKLLQFIYKIYGTPKNKRAPIGFFIMAKIMNVIEFDVLIDVRDWYLMIVLHVAGFRGGDLCAAKWTDVVIDRYKNTFSQNEVNVLVIFLDSDKTSNQSAGAVVTISCPRYESSFNILPVLEQYIKLLKLHNRLNTWMFPSLSYQDRKKDKHITTTTIRSITKRRIKQINLDPKNYGAHSYRIAFVHDAIASGIPEEFIMKLGRWKSQCWRGYHHDVQYAQAQATSQLMKFSEKFETKKTKKKHKELLQTLASNIKS